MRVILKDVRKSKNISQEKLAELSGVTRQTIIRIENNDSVEVRLSTLILLANALGCTVPDLICS